MAKRPKKNPVRDQVKSSLEDLANKTLDGSADIADVLEGRRSHLEIHCAETPPDYFDKTHDARRMRDKYFSDPDLCTVERLCVARAIEKGADQVRAEQKSYFPDNASMRKAYANNILRNSTKIARFYCEDREVRPDRPFVDQMPTNNPMDAPSGRTIQRDPTTGAIREKFARSTALVLEHDQMATPRATPKLTGLSHVTFYPFAPENRPALDTGRDLRSDVSCTRTFAESGRLGQGYLLACANPDLTPVRSQYIEYIEYNSGRRVEQLQVPIDQGTIALSAVGDRMSLKLETGGPKGQIDYRDERFSDILNRDANADQKSFVNNVILEMRKPVRHLPKKTTPVAEPEKTDDRRQRQDEGEYQ